jgi:hypothetical protein
MNRLLTGAFGVLLGTVVSVPAPAAGQAKSVPSIRRVQVMNSAGQVEIEIEASDRILPRMNVLTGPDRLVMDFVNAVPSPTLHNQTVNRGGVKDLRVGVFSANPPVARIVVDLNGPQPYQVFPSGRTVIVKLGESSKAAAIPSPTAGPKLVNTNFATPAAPPNVPVAPAVTKPALSVSFEHGLLSVSANKATLSEILYAIHQRTGAEIAIPAGAEQEQVVTEIRPEPAPVALAYLLNGSKFNFLILSSATDPTELDKVILSSRPEGPAPAPPPRSRVVDDEAVAPEPQQNIPPPVQPAPEATETDKPAAPPEAPNPPQKPAGESDPTINDPGR